MAVEQTPNLQKWHALEVDRVMGELSSTKSGLNQADASSRLKRYGRNIVKRTHHFQALKILLRQFEDLLIILLLVSVAISWYLQDTQTTVVLGIIIAVNILIGFFEEYRADRVMESLQRLLKPTAKVIRGGESLEIEADTLVPGDIIILEAGDSVPADVRLFSVDGLMTNDYALTGESTPSNCSTAQIAPTTVLADRNNMVYMGTTIAAGTGRGIVVTTGMATELGTIAKLSQEANPGRSPLQKEIAHLAKRITQGTLILITILVPIASGAKFGLKESFLFAIGIAAAMIPQGLPAEVNVTLAQAAGKLAKARALVKRLTAVETLGATQIICTDKTGTLTKNEMTVTNLFSLDGLTRVEGVGFAPQGRLVNGSGLPLNKTDLERLRPLIDCGMLASNATIHEPDQKHSGWYSIGDPTEAALITLAKKSRLASIASKVERVKEFPFDSDRKVMSVVVRQAKQGLVYAKGSPEAILERSEYVLISGKTVRLTTIHKKKIMAHIEAMADQAMRNLAMAYRPLPLSEAPTSAEQAEAKLVFLGVASMIDPPREEVAEAMRAAREAHMLVTIITGDEARTATAIADQVGFISSKKPLIIDHHQLQKLNDRAIVERVLSGRAIFARVSPADKLRIVEVLKKAGYILAVTGDGINDAPALKQADIGVAMGRIGSDVAKDSAEIVLLDDSFHTLVSAIQQGRVIFQNIRKSVLSCLTSNSGELITVLLSIGFGALFGLPLAISVTQILAIDLMAELFPIAALGWDPATTNLMQAKPRDVKNHIMNLRSILDLLISGLVMGALAYTNFMLVFVITGNQVSAGSPVYLQATTVAYVTIALCQVSTVLSRRTAPGKSIFSRYLFTNWHLWVAFGMTITGVLLIIYVPMLAKFIGNAPIGPQMWALAILAAILYLAMREVVKVKWRLSAS